MSGWYRRLSGGNGGEKGRGVGRQSADCHPLWFRICVLSLGALGFVVDFCVSTRVLGRYR